MRVSEKTIELSYCYQMGARLRIVFGLTQAQEARAGFDACMRLNGRLLILQFKSSNKRLSNGNRQFQAGHRQMVNLRGQVRTNRGVYYVFPTFGNTLELARNTNIIDRVLYLDVNNLPQVIPPPTTNNGTLRQNRVHYIDVDERNLVALIHSKPFETKLIGNKEFIKNLDEKSLSGLDLKEFETFEKFNKLRESLSKYSVAIIQSLGD